MVAMSQPLGLKPAEEAAYVAYLFGNHDFAIAIDVLKLDHTWVRSVTSDVLDGQVNVQRDSAVMRTASFTFDDPDHSMHLDADSPWEGPTYADRMIRVRHTVTVPGVGRVEATPFVGPIVKVTRNGDTLAVECQDKASLAITGCTPVKAKKGADAVDAIRHIMRDGAGENRFRLPSKLNRNLHKAYATGWHDDASPWVVCSRIADQLNMQLLYSCDGYLTLRKIPSQPSLTNTSGQTLVTGAVVTSPPQVDFDSTQVANMVRVSGALALPQQPQRKRNQDARPQLERPPTQLNAVAVAAPTHPLSAQRLGRNGVPRYLPIIIEGSTYKSLAQARSLATTTLDADLQLTTGVSFDMIPVFHLDVGDLIVAQTAAGRVVVRLSEASIPLSISGDMSIGTQRRVSTGHGMRIRAGSYTPPATRAQRKAYQQALREWRKKHRHHG